MHKSTRNIDYSAELKQCGKAPGLETKNIGSDFIMSVLRDKMLGEILGGKIW